MKKKSNLKMKSNKGITLIALVITIVVLIILATVSINMILNDDGILGAAELAKGRYQNAVLNEQSDLATLEGELNKHLPKVYKVGDQVKIKNHPSETFYVIASNGDNLTLLAKDCINTTTKTQGNANTITFSETYYWKDYEDYNGGWPEYDLIEEVPDENHYAARAAYDYGASLGGKGRLLTYTEAKFLDSAILFEPYDWWIGTVVYGVSDDNICVADSYNNKGYFLFDWTDKAYKVRPVVEISKDSVEFIVEGGKYKIFTKGQAVFVNNHLFAVLESSNSEQENVTLISTMNKAYGDWREEIEAEIVEFSTTNYWANDFTTSPYDLSETGVPDASHTAAKIAYDYGYSLGGRGRLLKYSEAMDLLNVFEQNYQPWGTGQATLPEWFTEMNQYMWVAAAASSDYAGVVGYGYDKNYNEAIIFKSGSEQENLAYVYPVVEIDKNLVSIGNAWEGG